METSQQVKFDFSEAAKEWDTPERTARARVVAGAIASELPESTETMSAMEFGCGTGLVSFFLNEQFSQIDLVDTSEGMIQVLNQKLQASGMTHMQPMVCDLFEVPSVLKTYDVIYTAMTMHHIQDTQKLLSRFYQLLKPQGKLFLIDLDEEDGSFHSDEVGFEGHNGFNQGHLKQLMGAAGFTDNTSRIIFEGEKERKSQKLNYALFMATGLKR